MTEQWFMKNKLGLVLLGALLSACGSLEEKGDVGRISGSVLAPGNVALQAVPSADVAAPDWSAPRARGQVLILGRRGGVGAQAVTALSNVQTQEVGENLTRAFTPFGESDEVFAARLAASGLRTQPNYIYRALAAPTPNDPGYPTNAGVPVENNPLDAGTLYVQDNLTTINAKGGWNAAVAAGNTGLRGVKVAVLDTGVTRAHEDLQGRLLAGRDFCAQVGTAENGDVFCQGEDADTSETSGGEAGHGTNSLGIIGAATNNGKGIAGLTWSGQNMLPVKVFGTDFSTDPKGVDFADTVSLTKGVNYAVAQQARVINLSLGFAGTNVDPALSDAIASAYDQNVVIVAAAGNVKPNATNKALFYPASDPHVIAVGAVNEANTLAAFSARPSGSDQRAQFLVAPGGTANNDGYDIVSLSKDPNAYRLWAGTSEAAPQVAGAAALLLYSKPGLTVEQVRAALVQGAKTTSDGYKLLDVGRTLTVNPVLQYEVTVRALQDGQEVDSTSTAAQSGNKSVPYQLDLPFGTYTLRATISTGATTYTGQTSVTVNGDKTNVNIQTK